MKRGQKWLLLQVDVMFQENQNNKQRLPGFSFAMSPIKYFCHESIV